MVDTEQLRTGLSLGDGAHLLPKRLVQAVDEAKAVVARARGEAADIVAKSREQYEREKARGYEEGRRRALGEAVARLAAETALLHEHLSGLEEELAELVIRCTRQLVQDFDDNARAASLVRAALGQMRREKRAELRVAPEQHAHMRDHVATITQDFPEVELVDVLEDATLQPGTIVLETAIGRVEGDIGRDLTELETLFRRPATDGATA